jgi:hypothetical protein
MFYVLPQTDPDSVGIGHIGYARIWQDGSRLARRLAALVGSFLVYEGQTVTA